MSAKYNLESLNIWQNPFILLIIYFNECLGKRHLSSILMLYSNAGLICQDDSKLIYQALASHGL